jgi:hypothetical protein
VIDPGLDNGFFNSRIIYAAQALALYITKWQNVQSLGDPYSLLADRAAGFDDATRDNWAHAQQAELFYATHDRNAAKDTLSDLLKLVNA